MFSEKGTVWTDQSTVLAANDVSNFRVQEAHFLFSWDILTNWLLFLENRFGGFWSPCVKTIVGVLSLHVYELVAKLAFGLLIDHLEYFLVDLEALESEFSEIDFGLV